MSQVILLSSYAGLSDYQDDVTCTGPVLDWETVVKLELSDNSTWERHRRSSWCYDWYEVSPDDQITLLVYDGDHPENNCHLQFTVPEAGLIDPPQSLDDSRSGQFFIRQYLESQCSFTVLPHPFASDE